MSHDFPVSPFTYHGRGESSPMWSIDDSGDDEYVDPDSFEDKQQDQDEYDDQTM